MKEIEKKQYTHNEDWENIPPTERKLLMFALKFYNEAGNHEDAIKLIRNRWVRKVYPLPRPNHHTYNSRKKCRSQYWLTINAVIRKYIIELPS